MKKQVIDTCVYCGMVGKMTRDHVVPRKLMLEKKRNDNIIVKACKTCNNAKSALELYLLTVLPFGGNHPDASELLNRFGQERIDKRPHIKAKLIAGKNRAIIVDPQTGLPTDLMTLPFDGHILEKYLEYVTKALVSHHFCHIVAEHAEAITFTLSDAGNIWFTNYLRDIPLHKVAGNIGDGTLIYTGLQMVDVPSITIWTFQVLGGLRMGTSLNEAHRNSTVIVGISAPKLWMDDFKKHALKQEIAA